jgi:glycolate oxidase FAD binding subunit
MVLTASNIAEVAAALSTATSHDTITAFNLRQISRVLEYTPEDMTVSVEAGITLAELQCKLGEHGQWLPIDPPQAEDLTIGALLAGNKSGPRRYGYGTIRDYLLGIKVVLADGRTIKAGGKVVKNVAGYDLCKLFVGSRGTLGAIVEATFKVLPKPETEKIVAATFPTLEALAETLEQLAVSSVVPVIIDAHNHGDAPALVVGFAGANEDVAWQLGCARELGFTKDASLEYEQAFWDSSEPVECVSVLPSKVVDTLRQINAKSYVARAGNGIIYYRGGKGLDHPTLPRELMRRIKDTYDPKHLLPELPW